MNPSSAISPAAQQSLAHMHHLLGRNRISSWWEQQSRTVREGICRAAALKPVLYWNKPLADMSDEEREAIRRAVVSLKTAMQSLNVTDRSEWLQVPDFINTNQKSAQHTAATEKKDALQQQAQRMQQQAEMIKAAQL